MAGLTFADLLGLLGHTGRYDYTSVCHRPPGGAFSSRVVPSGDAAAIVPATGDCWFSVNPLTDPATWSENKGRGTAGEVSRLAALHADFDVKIGGMVSMEAAGDLVNELSTMLGTRPVAMVLSGHGVQPYWAIEDGPSGGEARALLRRWGRLVAHVAGIQGSHVDPVFDLSRVLRVPDTMNYKSTPVPVLGIRDRGRALTVEEADDALRAYGCVELPGDTDEPGNIAVNPPANWQWAPLTCTYAVGMAGGWRNDHPTARHPWLLAQATRIAAGHRNGCYNAAGHNSAVAALVDRFRDLLSHGPEARKESPGEIADALGWGQTLAAAKTDAEIATELGGGHSHEPADSDLTFKRGDAPPFSQESASPNNVSLIRRTRLTSAAEIEPEPVFWTWLGRIPRGEIALTPGRGGIGKSTFHAWLIAKLTLGVLPGIHYGKPAPCVIAATEDSWSRTIVPRLMAAGADRNLVYRVDVVSEIEGATIISLPRDIPSLQQNLVELGAALLSVDPLMGVVDGHLDTHKDRDVRLALSPLMQLADETQCTILGNAHFNKGAGSDPLALVMGSAAFGNVARAVLGFARDTDADEDGTCVISLVKNNLGRTDWPSLTYRIENMVIPTSKGPSEVGRLVMTGESARSVTDILAAANNIGSGAKIELVAAWIKRYVGGTRLGYASAGEVIAAGIAAGYEEHTIKRARSRAGLSTVKKGMEAGWFWCLPGIEPSEDNTQGDKIPGESILYPSFPSNRVSNTESNYLWQEDEEDKKKPPPGRDPFGRLCRTCHNPLLLIREGRDQCEKCRLAGIA